MKENVIEFLTEEKLHSKHLLRMDLNTKWRCKYGM